jgi:BirA family biotin operon repressor/biotin-[acetyl-CoA-carboxylase] ligase
LDHPSAGAPDAVVTALLQGTTRFHRCVHVAACASTQDLAATPPLDGDAVFWADHQTHGRGRQQRSWHDEPGVDLAVTFRATVALPQPIALAAALPVAVAEAVEPLLGRALRVKWPNDVYLDGRKLSGVLVDSGMAGRDTWLIGVGVNCNRTRFPPELEATATSIAIACGAFVDRGMLLVALAQRLDGALREIAAGRMARLEAAFRDRLGLVGRRVVLDAGGEHTGELAAIDFAGARLATGAVFPLAHVRALRPQ